MGRKHSKEQKATNFNNSKTKVKVRQSAQASIGQGGNAIVINASEIGVVRIRP
ncbi:hypothetical protein [Paenibacillus sp. SI8]|uniref:hypothetical protein n=1 Tax=unclassified Paenibacillus TaxID=185978 RepID=UPI00346670E1